MLDLKTCPPFALTGCNLKSCPKRNDRSKFLEKYPNQVRQVMWYDGSKPGKLFFRPFHRLRYYSAFCVIILVEYFVLFILCK